MKFLHLSDLHIGKRFFEKSLEEDFRNIFNQINKAIEIEKPEAILISGDVYDTTTPSAESVSLFDEFLTSISNKGAEIFIISGNHDSADRLAFGNRLFTKNGIHISDVYSGKVERHCIGNVAFHLLPFIRPSSVRRFTDEKVETFNDAVKIALNDADLSADYNVLLSHQFVVSNGELPEQSESEVYVGGVENVDSSIYDGFDYVALGHLHSPQSAGKDTIRYCGSPLKFSFSEREREKSITVVEIDGNVTIRMIPLKPLRELRVLTGPIDNLVELGKTDESPDDYIFVHLTDITANEPMARLRSVFPNIMGLDFVKKDKAVDLEELDSIREKMDINEVFGSLFEHETGQKMNEKQKQILESLISELEVSL